MDRGVIKSAGRVLALFEHLREVGTPVTVTDIANALQIPTSSASVLLKSLLSLGYLVYDNKTRRYRPTYRIALLGDWLLESTYDDAPISRIMAQIGKETGEAVLLGQQNQATLQYVHVVPSSYPVRLHIPVGTQRPMTCTATGKVLLSIKANQEIRAIVRRNNAEAQDDNHRVSETAFMEEMERVRAQGFAETCGDMTAGAAVIAMLVPVESGTPPLAIGVGGVMERVAIARDHLIEVMRKHLGGRKS
ncbi:MAG: IclR family transcriptional regulator [Sphingorhabdus sp.]